MKNKIMKKKKEYTIELEPSFKYLNGTIENGNKIILTKTGYELNNETNTQKINQFMNTIMENSN